MSGFLIKVDIAVLLITIAFAVLCFVISKNLWFRYSVRNFTNQDMLEYGLASSLKAFTGFYLISILLMAVSIPAIAISIWPELLTLPGEMPYIVAVILGLVALGGIVSYITSIKRRNQDFNAFLIIDPVSEPELYHLVFTLAEHFGTGAIKEIRITPGSDISLAESADTFDNVFSGKGKVVEIGLSAMELLSAGDLKVLLARQFAYYATSDDPPISLIRRLKKRLEAMSDNIIDTSFLLMFNPVAWMILAAKNIVDLITSDYQLMAECKADYLVAEYSGSNRLTHALARYGVETQLYRELIDIVESHERGEAAIFDGNIYDSMRRAQTETTDELKVMVEHLFRDAALSRGDIGKKTLKLRLKKLSESPELPNFEINRPAIAYLKDWHTTENRMIKLLKI